MVKIDVMGDSDASQTMDVLTSLYANAENVDHGNNSYHNENMAGKAKAGKTKAGHSIVIINGSGNISEQYLRELTFDDIVLINSDDKEIHHRLNGNKARIITYGFNTKACVTASSVVENEYKTLQCCIQRSMMTFSGKALEQQEFSVNIQNPDINIHSVLAAVTAALVNDIPVATIAATVID